MAQGSRPYPCCLAPLREAFFDGVAIGQWHPALRVVHQGLFENEQNASFWDTVYWYNLVCTY